MALATYSDLQAAVANWIARTDVAGEAADFITLAEARLNRVLDAVEVSSTLTGVVGSRQIDISSLSMVEPISLFVTDTVSGDEIEVVAKTVGTFAFDADDGRPQFYSINGNFIEFERECDVAYSFRFRHTQRFALSDVAQTNWLMTYHPDVYLAAVLIWGGVFTQDSAYAATFLPILESGIKEVGSVITNTKRGELSINPALGSIGRWHGYGNYWS